MTEVQHVVGSVVEGGAFCRGANSSCNPPISLLTNLAVKDYIYRFSFHIGLLMGGIIFRRKNLVVE